MALNLNDRGISRELLIKGIHEANSTRQFRQEIKSGSTVVEIGANVGYYTLITAQLIGETGRILAFEPSPENMRNLRENLSLNGLEDLVETHELAVGRQSGRQNFYLMNKGNTSSFFNRESGNGLKQVKVLEVEMTSLDEFLHERNVKCDYFRMDVEGYEVEIIAGMRRVLTGENPPSGCFIEVHSALLGQMGYSARAFVESLSDLDYQVKTARYRGRDDIAVYSNREMLEHPLIEVGYWETFFERRKPQKT